MTQPPGRGRLADGDLLVAAVGDVVLARDDPGGAFRHVGALLGQADLRVCNLEVALSDEGMPQHGKFETLHASPRMIDGYVAAGFEAVSLANNHTMDFGPVALMDTIELLQRHGIRHAGAGGNREQAWAPLVMEVRGRSVGIVSFASEGHLGYGANAARPGIAMIRRDPLFGEGAVSPDDVEAMRGTIGAARERSEWVLACFHWGLSQSAQPSVSQRYLARTAIEAGADVVIGHHPHVLQGVEVYRGAPILYSMGNFVFDLRPYFFGPWTDATAIAVIELGAGGVTGLELVPIWIGEDGSPLPLDEGDDRCDRILAALQAMSQRLATPLRLHGNRARVVPA